MDERNYTQTLLSIKICLGLCKTHGYYLQCPPTTVRSWRDSFIAVQYPIIPILYKFTHTFPRPPRLSITLSDSQMDGLLLGIITVRSHDPEEETVWKQETRGVSLCVASECIRARRWLYDSIWAGLLSLGSRDYSRLSRDAYAPPIFAWRQYLVYTTIISLTLKYLIVKVKVRHLAYLLQE